MSCVRLLADVVFVCVQFCTARCWRKLRATPTSRRSWSRWSPTASWWRFCISCRRLTRRTSFTRRESDDRRPGSHASRWTSIPWTQTTPGYQLFPLLLLKMICNDFLVVKVNCWSYVFNIIQSMWTLMNIKDKKIAEKSVWKCALMTCLLFASDDVIPGKHNQTSYWVLSVVNRSHKNK